MKNTIASKVLMIQPICFGFNEQTAASNSFQQILMTKIFNNDQVQEMALLEFRNFVEKLKNVDIQVVVFEDTLLPHTPDSLFPNNWFSTDVDQNMIIYPMATVNRRAERREEIISFLQKQYKSNDYLVHFEEKGKFLEGTGSLIIDRHSKTVFAAVSERTDQEVLNKYAEITGNNIVSFEALGPEGEPIYHTNVMLCMTDKLVIIGKDTIVERDRERVVEELKNTGKELLFLTNEQVYKHFAGNMLQLQNKKGEKFVVMSSNAKRSLTQKQKDKIESFDNQILDVPLNIIEQVGGGSARCMLAELF